MAVQLGHRGRLEDVLFFSPDCRRFFRFLLSLSLVVVYTIEGGRRGGRGGEGVYEGEGGLGRDGLWAVNAVGVAPGEDGRAEGEVGDENQWRGGGGRRRRRGIERRYRRVEAEVDAGLDAAPLEGLARGEDDRVRHQMARDRTQEILRWLLLLLLLLLVGFLSVVVVVLVLVAMLGEGGELPPCLPTATHFFFFFFSSFKNLKK